jgi:peptidoglycan/LPS O-acetylase OafA/YrhL
MSLVRLSTAPRHATPQPGFHFGSFLLGLTALLAALLSMARHPFLATLLTLGAMALLLSAAAGICGIGSEMTAIQNTRKGEL